MTDLIKAHERKKLSFFVFLLSLLESLSIHNCSIHSQILKQVSSGFQQTVKNSNTLGILQDFVERLELLRYFELMTIFPVYLCKTLLLHYTDIILQGNSIIPFYIPIPLLQKKVTTLESPVITTCYFVFSLVK